MGKSIRSKVKKRFRAVKKQRVNMLIDTPRAAENNAMLKEIVAGTFVAETTKKNAFLYPEDPDAEFPQAPPTVPLDFRSEALPMSGYAACQNRRKFTPEEREMRRQKMLTIPEAEAQRLGLMADDSAMEMGGVADIPGIPESMMKPNMFAGAVIDGVKREMIRPEKKQTGKKQTKRVVNGKKAHGGRK